MRVEYLYRYPVKGLTAEALEATEVEAGGAIPWDRAFALAQGGGAFNPEAPGWVPKTNFMCLMKNAGTAALRSHFDVKSGILTIRAPDGDGISENALNPEGQTRIAAFLAGFMGEEARGTPTFHHTPGHVFGDNREPVISLINIASLQDYEAKQGARRHRRRFRANVWFSGAAPWSEFDWIGKTIQMGGAMLRVTDRIVRCPATEVNPVTAQRDADPIRELRTLYGHTHLGIFAEVIEGGRFAVGDGIEVLPE